MCKPDVGGQYWYGNDCEQKVQLNLVIISQTSIVIIDGYNVMVSSEELIGATEYFRLQAGCHKKTVSL
jgi:hypothetical protein